MKKDIRKTIRLTITEWETIESKLKEFGISFSSFARSSILRTKIKTANDREILYHIQRMGNNLNQLARHVNTNKSIDRIVVIQLKEIKDDIQKILK